jgi:hypothetical protein
LPVFSAIDSRWFRYFWTSSAMAVKAIIPFLVGMMLLTGCANTILTKYQDQQCVRNCDEKDKKPHTFEQPVIQT